SWRALKAHIDSLTAAGQLFDAARKGDVRRLTENHRTPLHFAVLKNRQEMISLLLELGADPLAVDGSGQPIAIYATAPDTDRRVMEKIRSMTSAELISAARGHRPPRGSSMDLVALLALGEWDTA